MLRDQRKHKSITQSVLSKRAGGLKQSTVSNFENNPSSSRVDTLFKLVNALGLEIQIVEKQVPTRLEGDEW